MDDATEIANLLYAYADRIDHGDYAGVGALFADGAISTPGGEDGETRGAAAVEAMYTQWTKRFPDTGTPKTKHVTTNLIIEVDGDTATCRSYFCVHQRTDAIALQPIIAGRYHDRFEKVDGRWRFTHRHIMSDLFGDLSDHLLQSF